MDQITGDIIQIKGGQKLFGTVAVSGAKNAALPAIMASLLTDEVMILNNIPDLEDVHTALTLLRELGVNVRNHSGKLVIDPSTLNKVYVPEDIARRIRYSVLLLGVLLARKGEVRLLYPGGCSALGDRPIDIHLAGLKALGAHIEEYNDYVYAYADHLHGCEIHLRFPTVTGTQNIMLAATLAKGATVILNAAREPEILDLAVLLNSMGAHIVGAGTKRIIIEGVKKLHGANHRIIADRIEAGTFLAAVGCTGGEVTIKGIQPEIMLATLQKLQEMGTQIVIRSRDEITAFCSEKPLPVSIITGVYPQLPTDMQPILLPLTVLAQGESYIEDTVFPKRFAVVKELRKMGAQITTNESQEKTTLRVHGISCLHGTTVIATDLRAGAALILAGMAAKGITTILNAYEIHRGYERIMEKWRALGADITVLRGRLIS